MAETTAPERVECKHCDKLLAQRTGERLEVKFQDLLIAIEGGRVAVTCPKCQTVNAVVLTGEAVFVAPAMPGPVREPHKATQRHPLPPPTPRA